jgi:hypothetical protein
MALLYEDNSNSNCKLKRESYETDILFDKYPFTIRVSQHWLASLSGQFS